MSCQSAARWLHAGVVPVVAYQLATGMMLVGERAVVAGGVAVYAGVWSADERGDVDRRVAGLVEHSTGVGVAPAWVVFEVGSGVNGYRTKLVGLLRDLAVGAIVVEDRDRLESPWIHRRL